MSKLLRKRNWKDMSSPQRVATVALGILEAVLAIAAWRDLSRRPASQVRGRKRMWAAVLPVNVVGPVAYFTFGRVPEQPTAPKPSKSEKKAATRSSD